MKKIQFTESIHNGILWLYYKGVKVNNVKYDEKGNIIGGDVSWNGGSDWSQAAFDYNGKGDKNYMTIFKEILKALKQNSTKDYVKEKQDKSEKSKKNAKK